MNHLKQSYQIPLVAILFCTAVLCAQKVQFSMERPPYYKNTPFTYQVGISGDKTPDPPRLARSDDFRIQPLPPQTSSSTQVTIINGDMKKIVNNQTIYTFRLTPRKTGRLHTPACTVVVDGRTRTIAPQPIDVEQPNLNQTMTLSMTADRKVAALGQPIRLDFRWTTRIPRGDYFFDGPIQGYELTIPALNQDNLDADTKQSQQANARQRVRLTANGQTPLEATQYLSGNKISILFSVHVIPRKPGKLTIEPASVVANVADENARRRRRSIWDDPFFSSAPSTIRCAAESQPLDITVKEPPADGRPASYAGLAEPCTIAVSADRQDVYVGDPIILSITLKGPRFPASVILPKLHANRDFAKDFRVFDSNAPGTVNRDGSVTFQRTVRATSPDVTRIPPVEIAWFDATEGTYHTASSKPIPITVQATKNAVPQGKQAQPEIADKVDVTANQDGPQPNRQPEACLHNQAQDSPAAVGALEITLLFLWPLAAILVFGVRRLVICRRRNAPLTLRRKAAATAIAQLQKAADTDNPAPLALAALQAYLSAKTQQPRNSITLQDMETYLQSVKAPAPVIRQTRDLVNRCEAAIYAKQPLQSPEDMLQSMQELIRNVEKL